MANWNQIFNEYITEFSKSEDSLAAAHTVRENKIKNLFASEKRNVIAYYSGWLQKTSADFSDIVSIGDDDKNGFMACFHELDFSKGLDLILHSPGGSVAATESIIHYIRSKFKNDVRVFIPQISMSGGTMIAFCGNEIWMGNHSNLGPIDPQFGNMPARLLLAEFDTIWEKIEENPNKINLYRPILEQIVPTFLSTCENAVKWSEKIAEDALSSGMFSDRDDKKIVSKTIAKYFADETVHYTHGKHIHREQCKEIGLTIMDLEENQNLQDMILSIHHAFMISFTETNAAKLIQNHKGIIFGKAV